MTGWYPFEFARGCPTNSAHYQPTFRLPGVIVPMNKAAEANVRGRQLAVFDVGAGPNFL
ncbi:MAG: hypothetical protein ACREF3_13320 [Acetobacteraceae bacterium]